jgi:prevent-host-death family protein
VKTIELANATATLAEYTNDLGDEPVILTKNGKPIAALVSLENVDAETLALSTNQNFMELIEHARQQHQAEGGISAEEMRRRLKIK